MKSSYAIKNIEELSTIAEKFVQQFPTPQIFAFIGEMGVGKTTFIKKICELLGADLATSPTFSLVNEYVTKRGIKIFHLDLYRVKSMEEALDFGIEEYLAQEAYIFIEWPMVVMPLLKDHHELTIVEKAGIRHIEF